MSHWEKKINSRTAMYSKSFIQCIRMHFPTKVIPKLKVFSCQILRNNVGKDTKAFHSFINDNAHWSVNNLKKMKIIELLYQSIHPSLENRFQLDGLSHFHDVYPKKEFLLRGKNKQLILQSHAKHLPIWHSSMNKLKRNISILSLKAKLHQEFYYITELQVKMQ